MGSFEGSTLTIIRRVVVGTLGYTLCAASITVLYLGMRAVMDIGGRCASGGSLFPIANECPEGVGPMIMGSVFTGLIGLAIGAVNFNSLPGPRLWMFAWTALFGSLGWNFMDYGRNPPPEMGVDTEWGWIACGVMFWLMAIGPLFLLFSRDIARKMLWADAGQERHSSRPTVRASTIAHNNPNARLGGRPASEINGAHTTPTTTPSSTPWAKPSDRPSNPTTPTPTPTGTVATAPAAGGNLTAELERLAHLHRSGSLTDAEFQAAKGRVLDGSN